MPRIPTFAPRETIPATFLSTSVIVGTTPTLIRPGNEARTELMISNISAVTVYLGSAGVTTATGFPLEPGMTIFLDTTTAAIYGVVATGTAELRVVEV